MDRKLVVLEGLDGCGKSTQFERLLRYCEENGIPAKGISFPDYEKESSALVRMYLNGAFGARPGDVNAYAASAFYSVDRYASYQCGWKGEYEAGMLILASRYTTSNIIYQMTKLPKEQWKDYIDWLYDFEFSRMELPRPGRVLFLDMPVDISQKLLYRRYHGDESRKDLHESDISYLSLCREAAAFAAGYLGWKIIPCWKGDEPLGIEDIHKSIVETVFGGDDI